MEKTPHHMLEKCTAEKCCCNCKHDKKNNGGYSICTSPKYWDPEWGKDVNFCWEPIEEKGGM